MAIPIAPSVIRGRIIDSDLIEFGGRGGDIHFLAPDPRTLVDLLPLGNPNRMSDLYAISLDDILEFLSALGAALDLTRNAHLSQALELSYSTAPMSAPLLRHSYETIAGRFSRDALDEIVNSIGWPFFEGWVEHTMLDGRKSHVRAFGARALHIVAGNSPLLSALTIVRNAISRSDAIVKLPSNDPFTALAIARTMVDLAPDHPVTKHLSVAYWKGGDREFEEKLYQPHNLEKIVAWGGFASIKHVTRYIQPGLELISLDPKRSISIVGAEAFDSAAALDQAAVRLATDIGCYNQEACVNARVVYVVSGTDDEGISRLEKFGELVYKRLLGLPQTTSTAPKNGINRDLKAHLQGVSANEDWYRVIGGDADEGAIIVSKMSDPVDFAASLTNRVANLVPVDSAEDVMPRVDAYCQTVGIFPETLVARLRDRLALHGAQRVVSLGYAGTGSPATPQDGIEPLRRMCKWINNEQCDPVRVKPTWI